MTSNLDFTGVSSALLPSHEECGIDTQDRIYGGTKASLSEYPWMTLIEYEKGEQLFKDFSIKPDYMKSDLVLYVILIFSYFYKL